MDTTTITATWTSGFGTRSELAIYQDAETSNTFAVIPMPGHKGGAFAQVEIVGGAVRSPRYVTACVRADEIRAGVALGAI